MASPSLASALPVSTTVFPAFLGVIGFESLPALPIISKPFGYLKRLNLSSVGLGLDEVAPEFGWDMVLFGPILEQSRPKGVQGPSEAQTEVINVLDDSSLSKGDSDSVLAETRPEPVSDLSESKTRSEPVPDLGEAGTKPPLVFEDSVDDFLDTVADFEKDEEFDTPVVIVQPKTIKIPQTGEGRKKKRIKEPAGRTDLPLVHQFRAMQAKASSSTSQTRSVIPKTTPEPAKKSYRLASQRTPRTSKSASPSEQQPILVEEVVYAPESSPARDTGNAPVEQGSPRSLLPEHLPSAKA